MNDIRSMREVYLRGESFNELWITSEDEVAVGMTNLVACKSLEKLVATRILEVSVQQ